ncbi:glycyl radical protein [Candidatus Woesearchaeota archaeon]|nr:glycyl radical protein [Candidatus Woesearchaeota archaeon]
MNERIKKLRQQSLEAKPHIDLERAVLMTDFYENHNNQTLSAPVKRALAFKYVLDNKAICINEDDLIVGERGSAPKATPTYPELTTHTVQDFEILNSREKIPFAVSEETKKIQLEKIIPFWQGQSMRDKIFNEMGQDWKNAYEAGIFTEFMEQRAPGHTVLDDKIYKKGMLDFKEDIAKSLSRLDFEKDPDAYKKKEELKAMAIAADAVISYAARHAEKAKELLQSEQKPKRRQELEKIIETATNVPAHAPRDFQEALQYYWFVHLGVITELNTWDSFNPGRLDQHLYPFYKKGLEDGTLTKDNAKELLQAFWVKFNNQPAPPKVGVTAEESGTYTDFCLINTGGVKADGSDAVNELSYMILDVIQEMRLLQPSSMVQISKKTPQNFLMRALDIVKTGYGQPSIFNTDELVQEMLRVGKKPEDARNGGSSGCVETGAFGKEAYILTGYFNLPKILEITLNNGIDPNTRKKIGIETGNPEKFKSFDELLQAYTYQIRHFTDIKIKGSNIIEKLFADYMPTPMMSLLIDDCIATGKDYHAGGARYNTSYIQGVGIGSATDSLSSIKYNVFDEATKTLSMQEMMNALKANFRDNEQVREQFINKTPKYGNDDDYADNMMRQLFEAYFSAVDGRPNTRGGNYRINLLPTTVHVYFGKVTGALPDGRKAYEPLSEGVSPVQGADRKGPTAVLKSVAKMDHVRTGGTLLNQKFTPSMLSDQAGVKGLAALVRGYFAMDGHHIQFNVVDADTLRDAKAHPEQHRDLIVRVAGYSDYFCDLGEKLQDEIIKRTEHREY